jgi:voltage-gated potassium channel Kch
LLQVALFVAVALLAVRSSREPRPRVRQAVLAVLGGSVIVLVVALTASREVGQGVASIWTALLALLTVTLIVTRVLSFDTVTIQSIYGALSAYLIVGLMFASVYAAMNHLGGGHFFVGGQPGSTKTFQYFSFTTLTTLGYGDFTAAGNAGRAVSVLEALTGQVFLVTLVARLVATFRGRG